MIVKFPGKQHELTAFSCVFCGLHAVVTRQPLLFLFHSVCLSLSASCIFSLPRPVHLWGTLQTCHSLPVHKMPSDFPANHGQVTPTSALSIAHMCKSLPPADTPSSYYLIYPLVYTTSVPVLPLLSASHHVSDVHLSSSHLYLNLCFCLPPPLPLWISLDCLLMPDNDPIDSNIGFCKLLFLRPVLLKYLHLAPPPCWLIHTLVITACRLKECCNNKSRQWEQECEISLCAPVFLTLVSARESSEGMRRWNCDLMSPRLYISNNTDTEVADCITCSSYLVVLEQRPNLHFVSKQVTIQGFSHLSQGFCPDPSPTEWTHERTNGVKYYQYANWWLTEYLTAHKHR